jgi:hypothetical protein
MVEDRVKWTRCALVGMVNYVVEGSMLEKLGLVGAERWLKVEGHWSERHQQILGMDFAASTDIVSSSEMLAVGMVQPSRLCERVTVRSMTGRPYPLLWLGH